jgi:hypothetical protein
MLPLAFLVSLRRHKYRLSQEVLLDHLTIHSLQAEIPQIKEIYNAIRLGDV